MILYPNPMTVNLGDELMMATGFGLVGAHRTGKTTLARNIAETMKIPFVTTSTSAIATGMGIKIGLDMPFDRRVEFQEAALLAFEEIYSEHGRGTSFVTDRTPIDLAAYVSTAWHSLLCTPEQSEWADRYIKRCLDATNRWFIHLAILQPADFSFVEEAQKGENIDVYRESLNATMIGFAYLDEVRAAVDIVPRGMVDLKEREEHTIEEFTANMAGYAGMLKQCLPLQ